MCGVVGTSSQTSRTHRVGRGPPLLVSMAEHDGLDVGAGAHGGSGGRDLAPEPPGEGAVNVWNCDVTRLVSHDPIAQKTPTPETG
jgi:hypothetical protein